MPPGQLAELAKRTGGQHLKIHGAGHIVHDDAPQQFRGAVEAFLSRILNR